VLQPPIIPSAATLKPISLDPDVFGSVEALCKLFARWSKEAESMLKPFISKYASDRKVSRRALLVKRRQGGFDMLRDFHDLWLLVSESMMSLIVLEQAGRALRDRELLGT
jgi:hypothetical protein